MKITDVENFNPKCPHCEERIDEIYRVSDDQKTSLKGNLATALYAPNAKRSLDFLTIPAN